MTWCFIVGMNIYQIYLVQRHSSQVHYTLIGVQKWRFQLDIVCLDTDFIPLKGKDPEMWFFLSFDLSFGLVLKTADVGY